MAEIILRGRITEEGHIELIDPLPTDTERPQEVKVVLQKNTTIYETVNDYGDRVIIDEVNGTESPVEPLTAEELLNSPLIGLWADRKEEIGDSATWVRNLRHDEQKRDELWRGRKLS